MIAISVLLAAGYTLFGMWLGSVLLMRRRFAQRLAEVL
jgi:hypothetical protein